MVSLHANFKLQAMVIEASVIVSNALFAHEYSSVTPPSLYGRIHPLNQSKIESNPPYWWHILNSSNAYKSQHLYMFPFYCLHGSKLFGRH